MQAAQRITPGRLCWRLRHRGWPLDQPVAWRKALEGWQAHGEVDVDREVLCHRQPLPCATETERWISCGTPSQWTAPAQRDFLTISGPWSQVSEARSRYWVAAELNDRPRKRLGFEFRRLARGTDDAFDFLTEDGIAVEGSAARDGCGGQMMRMARRGRSSPGATASVTIAARSNARAPRCRR
jgi:hypothetical protein